MPLERTAGELQPSSRPGAAREQFVSCLQTARKPGLYEALVTILKKKKKVQEILYIIFMCA